MPAHTVPAFLLQTGVNGNLPTGAIANRVLYFIFNTCSRINTSAT